MAQKPLSIFTYYFKSKRKIIPVVLAIVLATIGTVATVALTDSIKKDVWRMVPFYEEYYVLEVHNPHDVEGLNQDVETEINALAGVDYYIKSHLRRVEYKALVGTPVVSVLYVQESEYKNLVEGAGMHLDEGRFPESGENEIVFVSPLMTNLDKEIGDEIAMMGRDGETFEIVGTIKSDDRSHSDVLFGFGSWNDIHEIDNNWNILYLIKPEGDVNSRKKLDGELEDISESLNEKYKDVGIDVYTEFSMQETFDNEFGSMDIIIWAIVIIVTVVMTICIVLLNLIFFMQRSGEFGILAALGYSKGFIIRKALAESFLSIILGWLMGLVFTFFIFELINGLVFESKGLSGLNAFDLRNVQFSLPIPIFVSVCSAASVLWQLLKLDPVEIIEKRD
ncbi:ABC transporter permease [Candidatus Dojkabacteria bacterium]|nr:ABC transporter permease [Candidatus Dojkabacteria bacterium]